MTLREGDAAAVVIAPLEASHVSAAADVMTAASDNEYSWSRAVGLPGGQAFFRDYFAGEHLPGRLAPQQPRSCVALDASNGRVVGICTVCDLAEDEAPHDAENGGDAAHDAHAGEAPPPGMAAIGALDAACRGVLWASPKADRFSRAARGSVGCVAFLGVDASARRRGTGCALVQRACEELRASGFAAAAVFCVSSAARALFERAGFTYLGGVHYHTFALPDGTTPFASLPPDECGVMLRPLL